MAYPGTLVGFASGEFAHVNALGNALLVGAISAVATAIIIDGATTVTTWPSSWFTIRIDSEVILIQSRSGTTLTVATNGRGYDNTVSASHADGARVIVTIPAVTFEKIQSEIINIQSTLGLSGSYNFFNSVYNAGTGTTLIADSSTPTLGLKSLLAGANMTITLSGNDLIFASTGSGGTIAAANEGSGAQVYDTGTSTPTAWKFRSLTAGSGITISQPVAGEILITNLNPTPGGGGDNLGNHTATQQLNMNSNAITNARGITSTSTVPVSGLDNYLDLTPSGGTAKLNGNSAVYLLISGATYLGVTTSSLNSLMPIYATRGFSNSTGVQKMTGGNYSVAANSAFSTTWTWPTAFFDNQYVPVITCQTNTLSYGRVTSSVTSQTTTQLTFSVRNDDPSNAYTLNLQILGFRVV